MTTLPIETRTAAWKPPTLTKSLARTVAKRLDKHWAQTGVKSLQDIRDALGSGVAAGMSMADRIEHQAAIKKWSKGLPKADLHKMFRMVEEIKNGKAREQYRTTDDALAKLRAASDDLPLEKALVEAMAEEMSKSPVWDQGFTSMLPSERQKAPKTAASYFDMFFKEKRIPSKVFEVKDSQGVTHSIPNKVVIDMIKQTRGSEKAKIEDTLRKIDFANGDVNHFLAHLAKGLAESYNGALRLGSQQEAEKLQAEAEANEQQANADRAKAEAAQMREASGGLYGYTKGTQRDVEASVRKSQRRALSVAKTLYAKDERSVDFLKAHAKRANSKTARLLLTAMKVIGPRVASDKTAAGSLLTLTDVRDLPSGDMRIFLRYMDDFYGSKGVYPDTKGRKVIQKDVEKALKALIKKNRGKYEWSGGDSLNREQVRDVLMDMGKLDPHYKTAALELPSERHASIFHGSPKEQLEYVVDALRLAGKQGLRVDGLPRKGALAAQQKGFADAERGQLFITPKGKGVRLASEEKVAGGLYGHPTKTARLALVACSDLRAYVGEVAYSLHSRRTAKYANMTGFLKEHGKTAKCAYSRMILSCYPDAPVAKQASMTPTSEMLKKAFVPDSVDGWVEWADGTRTAAAPIDDLFEMKDVRYPPEVTFIVDLLVNLGFGKGYGSPDAVLRWVEDGKSVPETIADITKHWRKKFKSNNPKVQAAFLKAMDSIEGNAAPAKEHPPSRRRG
jgi:hypothetical protein